MQRIVFAPIYFKIPFPQTKSYITTKIKISNAIE